MIPEKPIHPYYAPIPEIKAKGVGRGRPSIKDREVHPESELAKELGIPRGAMRNARLTGRLKFMTIGRKVYVSKRWVQEWVEHDAYHKQRNAQRAYVAYVQSCAKEQK